MSKTTQKSSENAVVGPHSPLPLPAPGVVPIGCPPGLEYLLSVNQLLIKQKVEILETLIGFETNNQYDIQNNFGQKIYLASENTDCCTRNCCGAKRAFEMRITDHSQREVIRLYRPFRCDNCFCFCCLQYMSVEAPAGHLIGHVVQDWSCLKPAFHIEDENGKTLLRVRGPFCTFSIFCQDVEFNVFSNENDATIGRITKQWSGILRETFTDADIYGVVFPMDLDVKVKALLLAQTFLIDFMFFEKSQNNERDRPGMMDSRW